MQVLRHPLRRGWRAFLGAQVTRPLVVLAGVTATLILALAASAMSGAVDIPWKILPAIVWGPSDDVPSMLRQVLLDIRLPRVLFSAVVGAALAVTGVAMQALFRNPLAEPGLVGITSGGALGAVTAIVLTAGSFVLIAIAAFIGSLLATFLAYLLGRRHPGMAGLLLAGIAVNAIAGSGIGLLTYAADDRQLRDLTFWSLGSVAGSTWQLVAFLGPWTLALLTWLCLQWKALNALLLGEREAAHLGYALKPLRRQLMVVIALVVGPLVAVTGGIGFVGLVVPHLVRMALGAHHRYCLLVSAVGGALLLVLADWLARVAVIPAELPIGLVTSLIGGPFFLWLLLRVRSTAA